MSESGEIEMGRPEKTKSKAERLLKKLTSQSCVKKGSESCASHSQHSNGGSLESPLDGLGTGVGDSAYTADLKLKIASSSAEILENVRRDSGDSSESRGSKIKYSKGESIESNALVNVGSQLKIRPELSQKFRPGAVNQIIETVVKEHLAGKEYSLEEAQAWTKAITDSIKQKTKELNFAQYKLVVCVVLGERRAQGIASAYRCLWDAEADCAASYTFTNDSIYCVGMVFGVYYY